MLTENRKTRRRTASIERRPRSLGAAAAPYQPPIPFDLDNATDATLQVWIAKLRAYWATLPALKKLELSMGWHQMGPDMAEELLRRTTKNRRVNLSNLRAIVRDLLAGMWMKTGESISLDTAGFLNNGQHRALSVYLTGLPMDVALITDADENTFAFIDSGKPRKGPDALEVAGFPPAHSGLISSIAKVDSEVKNYTPSHGGRSPKLSPNQLLSRAYKLPNVAEAARRTNIDWRDAVEAVTKKTCVGYVAMRVMDIYGEGVADEFFQELGQPDDTQAQQPIQRFRQLMYEQSDDARINERVLAKMKKKAPVLSPKLKPFQVLGLLILCFNAWKAGEDSDLDMTITHAFPTIDEPPAQSEAAE